MARQPEHLAEQQRTLGRYLAARREAAGLYQADIARAVPCHRTTVTHAEAGSQLPDADFWADSDLRALFEQSQPSVTSPEAGYAT